MYYFKNRLGMNYDIIAIWHIKNIDMDSLRQRKIKTMTKREIVQASLVSTAIVSYVVENG